MRRPWVLYSSRSMSSSQVALLTLHRGPCGPIVVRTAGISIHGFGKAQIQGSGQGSVIVVEASNVTIDGIVVRARDHPTIKSIQASPFATLRM